MRRRTDRTRSRRQGSLAVALLALAVAVGVVLPHRRPPPADPASLERAWQDLLALAGAFNAYCVDTGQWPIAEAADVRRTTRRQLTELGCLSSNTHALTGWSGPYVDPDRGAAAGGLVDPWGRTYLAFYLPATARQDRGSIRLLSTGPDRRLDTPLELVRQGRVAGDDLAIAVARLP